MQLDVFKVVLLLEVFIEPIHHFDSAIQELDPMPLLIDIKLIQFVPILVCKLLCVVQLEQLVSALTFAHLYARHDLHCILVFVHAHALKVLADLVVGVEADLDAVTVLVQVPAYHSHTVV